MRTNSKELENEKFVKLLQDLQDYSNELGTNLYSLSLAFGWYFSKYSILAVRSLSQLEELSNETLNHVSEDTLFKFLEYFESLRIECDITLGDPFFDLNKDEL